MIILGIETSCDETSASVVRDGVTVLSCVIASSRKDFERTGGVIPEDAARRQLEVMLPVLERALADAGVSHEDLDAIAVTAMPGLLGSLLVGTTAARTLAHVWELPLIPVHHTLGHLSSVWLHTNAAGDALPPAFPALTLSVSGGHSDLWYRTSHCSGVCIGSTRDDAAGEAFDKGAVMLGLPYPGGPALSKLAEGHDERSYDFPLPLQREDTLDFSFSGLKTSLKYLLRDLGAAADDPAVRGSIAASYQHAICRHLCVSLERAIDRYAGVKEVHIVGGVSANQRLRSMTEHLCTSKSVRLRVPQTLRFCTDNGAMIAAAGEFLFRERPEAIPRGFTTRATGDLADILSQ